MWRLKNRLEVEFSIAVPKGTPQNETTKSCCFFCSPKARISSILPRSGSYYDASFLAANSHFLLPPGPEGNGCLEPYLSESVHLVTVCWVFCIWCQRTPKVSTTCLPTEIAVAVEVWLLSSSRSHTWASNCQNPNYTWSLFWRDSGKQYLASQCQRYRKAYWNTVFQTLW